MTDPVSIRTYNPGAQWFGPIAQEFGATGAQKLPDGNNAAVFPDPVSGAAAHFALLSRRYAGMPLSDAIAKWSGGNSAKPYADYITKQTGLAGDTVLTPELLSGPQGLALVKAQAQWEAGKAYPLTDEQWSQAQYRAMSGQGGAAAGASVAATPAALAPGGGAVAAGGAPAVAATGAPAQAVQGAAQQPFDAAGETQAIMQAQSLMRDQDLPRVPPMQMHMPVNAARLRNALASRMGGQGGMPLPPSVSQRLAALIGRA